VVGTELVVVGTALVVIGAELVVVVTLVDDGAVDGLTELVEPVVVEAAVAVDFVAISAT
jgi:hypothetical protein